MSESGEPSVAVKKALFGLSGNLCAFSGCTQPMIAPDGRVLGETCHIKGRRKGSPRFDRSQPDSERRGFHNLIALCGHHHTVTNDESIYTVLAMENMKREHEKAMSGREIAPERIQIDGADTVVLSQNQTGGVTAGTVINLSSPLQQSSEPSVDSLQVLHAAVNFLPQADPGAWKGVLFFFRGMNGVDFAIGADQFRFNDPEHTAKMESCIEELLHRGLVSPKGEDYFVATHEGFSASKGLAWRREQYWWHSLRTPLNGIKVTPSE